MIGLCNRCGRSHELDTSALGCGTYVYTYPGVKAVEEVYSAVPRCESCVRLESRLAKLEAENDKLREQLEVERVRLAACGTAALLNTDGSLVGRLDKGNPYYSDSYGDVCRAVDREMALRQEREALQRRIALLADQRDELVTHNRTLMAQHESDLAAVGRDLALARAVLDSITVEKNFQTGEPFLLVNDASAWQAWKEGQK